jgi:hypothetical protein
MVVAGCKLLLHVTKRDVTIKRKKEGKDERRDKGDKSK